MMDIQLVVLRASDDADFQVFGGFSSTRKAKTFVRNNFDPKARPRPEIWPITVDEFVGLPRKQFATQYHVCLPCRDPLPKKPHVNVERIQVHPTTKAKESKMAEVDYKEHGGLGAYANGYSLKSGAEAFRLARIARRQWLKDHPDAKVHNTATHCG